MSSRGKDKFPKACVKIHASGAACFVIVALVLLPACDAGRRYAVLSFFFDGVPLPEPEDAVEDSIKGAGGAESGQKYYHHGPYSAHLCNGCHKPRTNKLILPKDELCLFCHTLPAKYTRLHGPLAAGGCTVCHDPHGAPNQALLVSDARDFCLYCHDQEDVMKSTAHRNTDETCTTCHDAHGADNNFLLKVQSSHNTRAPEQRS